MRRGWVLLLLAGCAWGVPATAEDEPVRRARVGIADPKATLPNDLREPEGKTRWYLDTLTPVRIEDRVTTADAFGEVTVRTARHASSPDAARAGGARVRIDRDPLAQDAAIRWWFPERDAAGMRPGSRAALRLERRGTGGPTEIWIDAQTVGIGWVHLPGGPREAVLQRARVWSDAGDGRGLVPRELMHRWIDPRAGVVAEVGGPVSSDGRQRLAVDRASWTTGEVDDAATLKIYADELDVAVHQRVLYGWDVGAGTPVSSLTPDAHATIGDLIAANTWDFSGNTAGTEIAATQVDVSAAETCNVNSCGYSGPGKKLEREDVNFPDPDPANRIFNNQVTEREDRPADVTIWLRAGAQKEDKAGFFGNGESRFCYVSEGAETRSPVPLWRFANQDAQGWFMQSLDTWEGGPFNCEQNLYNQRCGQPGIFFDELWAKPCGTHTGKQTGEVLKGGVVTLPSGHTLNALLVRTVADFCVYSASSCRDGIFGNKVDEVRTVVYIWQVPYLGTVVLLQSEQNVPDTTSWNTVELSDIRFGLFPPLSITAGATTDTTLDVSWNPGNDTHRIDGYKIYWDTDSGAATDYAFNSVDQAAQVTFAGTSATISGLTPGTTYYVTVTSLSDYANPNAGVTRTYESLRYPTQVSGDPTFVYPVEVQATTTGGACTPTTEVTGLTVDRIAGGIEICWSPVVDPCATGYRILGADTPESDLNFTPLADVGLVSCWQGSPTQGYFLVVATGTGGTGPWGHFGQ